MTRLIKVEGPECPDCGCADSRVVRTVGGFYGKRQWRECLACGRAFAAPVPKKRPEGSPHDENRDQGIKGTRDQEGGVVYRPVRCPKCQSTDAPVTKTEKEDGKPTIRRHKCRNCDWAFKSVEV